MILATIQLMNDGSWKGVCVLHVQHAAWRRLTSRLCTKYSTSVVMCTVQYSVLYFREKHIHFNTQSSNLVKVNVDVMCVQ